MENYSDIANAAYSKNHNRPMSTTGNQNLGVQRSSLDTSNPAVSFFRGLFGTTLQTNNNESSDEELQVSDIYVAKAERGVVVLKATNHMSESSSSSIQSLYIHIDLYSNSIRQYIGKRCKHYRCEDIQSLNYRVHDRTCFFDVKRSNDSNIIHKKFVFENGNDGERFKQYIDFLKDYGYIIRVAFDYIDRKSTRILSCQSLQAALSSLDIQSSVELVQSMLRLDGGDGISYDYHNFFHLFMNSKVYNVRDCLLEWIHQTVLPVDNSKESTMLFHDNINIELLPGEILSTYFTNIRWSTGCSKSSGFILYYKGILHVTNYRLILTSSAFEMSDANSLSSHDDRIFYSRYEIPKFFRKFSIPLSSIYRLSLVQYPRNIVIVTVKDFRSIRICLHTNDSMNSSKSEGLINLIEGQAFSKVIMDNKTSRVQPTCHLFAMQFQASYHSKGWQYSDIHREYTRLGLLDDSKFKVSL